MTRGMFLSCISSQNIHRGDAVDWLRAGVVVQRCGTTQRPGEPRPAANQFSSISRVGLMLVAESIGVRPIVHAAPYACTFVLCAEASPVKTPASSSFFESAAVVRYQAWQSLRAQMGP